MAASITIIFFLFWSGCSVAPTTADPGRDLCKMYGGGLKCSKMTSQLFPFDAFLSFDDDVARFTAEMKFLQIENSNISILQARSFQHMPLLSQLVLSNISLAEIEQGAFAGLRRLKSADLSHNQFRVIPIDAFKDIRITRLDFEGNTFLEIPRDGPILYSDVLSWFSLRNCNIREFSAPSAFGGVPSLVHLDLSQNFLTTLPDKIFAPLRHLMFLDLSGNRFASLNVDVFASMPSYPKHPNHVILSGNPWLCDCRISELALWATRNWKTDLWSDVPSSTRLGKSVTCQQPYEMSWNAIQFKNIMDSC